MILMLFFMVFEVILFCLHTAEHRVNDISLFEVFSFNLQADSSVECLLES